MKRLTRIAVLTLSALALIHLATPTPAWACGGLFCSAAMPVNQAAERIIFAFDAPQKRVTAVVEIQYQGPSEKFAWVLPVPGVPTVGVSASLLLDRLQAATNPTYSITRDWSNDRCGGAGGASGGSGGSSGAADAGAALPGSPDPAVTVLAAGSVGPYDYQLIQVVPGAPDPAEVAIAWLTTEGYDVGALGPDVLRPYLAGGMNLLAFRLSKNQMTGAIRPIVLSYDSERPMIPIRPTAVAANDDMGILVWVLGSNRAVPINYRSLELNETLIDWFSPATSYNQVVMAAADEAGGQGFVTELAAPMSQQNIAGQLASELVRVDQFRRMADQRSSAQVIVDLVEGFSAFNNGGFGGPFMSPGAGRVLIDGVRDVLARTLTLPPGVTWEDFFASPRCHFQELSPPGQFYCDGRPAPAAHIDLSAFDKVAFFRAAEELVFAPLEDTVDLFGKFPYLTRLYTTLSAQEMTLDPEFDLNRELPAVDNNHAITLRYTEGCFGDVSGPWEANVDGFLVRGRGTTWPVDPKAQMLPYNRRVMNLSAAGSGQVVKDNTAALMAHFGAAPPSTSGPGGMAGATGAAGATGTAGAGGPVNPGGAGAGGGQPAEPGRSSGGGCRTTGTSGSEGTAPFLLGLLALLYRRRRAKN